MYTLCNVTGARIIRIDSSHICLSSLAHESATMALESHPRQTLGKDVCRLILTRNLLQLHLRLVSRSEFPDSMNASVGMLGARIHATTFDEEDKCIVILCYESRRSLLISQKLHDPPQIHAIKRALRHAIELVLSAVNGGHGLTLRRPCYHCSSEHDSTSAA